MLLDVLIFVFRFSKASFNALTSSFVTFFKKLCCHLGTETYKCTEGCHGNLVISHVKL